MNEALRTDYRAGELAIEYLYIDKLHIDYLDVRVKQNENKSAGAESGIDRRHRQCFKL